MKAITVLIRNVPDEVKSIDLISEIEEVYFDAFEYTQTGCVNSLDIEFIEERPE